MNLMNLFKRGMTFFLLTILILVVAACGNGNDTETEEETTGEDGNNLMIFANWGGTTEEIQMESWAKPFMDETGVEVLSDNVDYGKLKAMVESGDVTWDVVDVEVDFAYQAAKEGLLEPIDFSVIDKSNLDEDLVFDYGVGVFSYAIVNAYNTNEVTADMSNGWGDFFDKDNIPGLRTAHKWVTGGLMEIALLADGVKPEDLYPIDYERAFAKLDEIKDDIVWWDTAAQSQQLLASGETVMGQAWNGRILPIVQEGADVEINWENNLKSGGMLVIPKGAKNKEAAMKFIATATQPQPQADFSNSTGYSPVNTDAVDLVDPDMKSFLTSEHADSQILLDLEYWSENMDEAVQKWEEWLMK